MADGKWISELDATTPLVDAARRVLTVRLQVVHDQLPLALHRWTEDCEHVHQLRVGTRRAGAALRIFEPCLPGKTFKKINKRLRQLRRAAGDARDWDVFAEALAEREQQTTAGQRPGLDFLLGYAQGQRVAAQAALEEVGQGTPFDFEALVAETLAAVQPPADGHHLQRLCDLGRPCLAELMTELHTAASENLEPYEHLHRVRILGKRLRYGMEVFVSCYKSDFKDEYYPMVEEMQEILGRANDSHVASQRLTFLRDLLRGARPAEWKRFRGGVEALLRYHQKRLPQQRRLFLKWWDRWRKSGAEAVLTGADRAVSSNL
jgi:CHAD domain-containing protein